MLFAPAPTSSNERATVDADRFFARVRPLPRCTKLRRCCHGLLVQPGEAGFTQYALPEPQMAFGVCNRKLSWHPAFVALVNCPGHRLLGLGKRYLALLVGAHGAHERLAITHTSAVVLRTQIRCCAALLAIEFCAISGSLPVHWEPPRGLLATRRMLSLKAIPLPRRVNQLLQSRQCRPTLRTGIFSGLASTKRNLDDPEWHFGHWNITPPPSAP